MRSLSTIFIILALITLGQASADPIRRWAPKIVYALKARDSVIEKIRNFAEEINTPSIEGLIDILEKLSSQFKNLDNFDVSLLEHSGTLPKEIQDRARSPIVSNLFHSTNLESAIFTTRCNFQYQPINNRGRN